MPTGLGTALLVGGLSAGGAVGGAAISSHAANKASKQQQDAASKAQAFNERVYNDQRGLMQPYVQAGTQSLSNLMQQHWGSPFEQQVASQVQAGQHPYSFGYQPSVPQGGFAPVPSTMNQPQQPSFRTDPDAFRAGLASGAPFVPMSRGLVEALQQQAGNFAMGQPMPVGYGQTPAAAAQGGPIATLRAPDGETAQVPVTHPNFQRMLAAGAKRVA